MNEITGGYWTRGFSGLCTGLEPCNFQPLNIFITLAYNGSVLFPERDIAGTIKVKL
jgi:hypothetical protein